MSRIVHHAIIVTSYRQEDCEKVRWYAARLALPVTELVLSSINHYYSFLVSPDGSKEGWDEDIQGSAARDKLISYIELLRKDERFAAEYVEVQYGSESETTEVTRYGYY